MIPELQRITRDNLDKIQLLTRLGQGEFRALAWSRDERWAAVATTRGIWLHDANNLEIPPVQLWSGDYTVNKVDFSPDSRFIASADSDGVIRIWDRSSRTLQRELKGHDGAVMSVRFSPDGTRLFSGGSDSSVRVWDAHTWELITTLPCVTTLIGRFADLPEAQKYSHQISYLIFSPDSSTLVACGHQHTNVFSWDANTYTLKSSFDLERWSVYGFAFADVGKTLVTETHWDKVTGKQFWDIETGEEIDSVTAYLWNQDPQSKNGIWIFADYSGRQQYQLKNTRTEEIVAYFERQELVFNPDKTKLLKYHFAGNIELWDLDAFDKVSQSKVFYRGMQGYAVFNADHSILAIGDSYSSGVQLWDVSSGSALGSWLQAVEAGVDPKSRVLFRPDGKLILVGCREYDREHHIQIWDINANELVNEFVCPRKSFRDQITHIVISPDWKWLVAGSDDGPLRSWHLESAEYRILWSKEGQKVVCAGFSPDGTHILVLSDDAMEVKVVYVAVRLINFQTGQEIFSTTGFTADFTPDGTALLISSKEDKFVTQAWNIRHKLKTGILPKNTALRPLSFSLDGQVVLISRLHELEFWDWQNAELLREMSLPDRNTVFDITVSPDGTLIAVVVGVTGDILLYGVPVE